MERILFLFNSVWELPEVRRGCLSEVEMASWLCSYSVTSAVSGKYFISAVLRYFPLCLCTEALWKARSLLQGCGKVYGEF